MDKNRFNQLSEEQMLKIVFKEIGKDPVVMEIENTLEAKQELVGGLIEVIPFNDNDELLLVCNEEGKVLNQELNIDMGFDYIAGNCFVIGDDYENGDFKSVPDSKIDSVIQELNERAVVIDKYMNRDKKQSIGITKEQFLNEIKEMIEHNIISYSESYISDKAKHGYEKEQSIEKQKLEYIKEIIKEERQKESRKKSDKEAR